MSSGAAVNIPTNYKIKEQDVNAKLQLYGIYSAFANGKVPSNKQIDVALNSVLAKSALTSPSKKLSSEGQVLVEDLRKVIEQAKILLLTKNEGNLIQDFIWQTQQISVAGAGGVDAPLSKDTAKQHGNQALDGLRTLGTLLISNGQFRKLLNDIVVIGRDIAGDAAQKAATKVNPSEDALAQVDKPAEDNTWHEVPDLSKDNLKQQFNDRKPFGKQEGKEHGQVAANKALDAAQQPDGSYSVGAGVAAGANHLGQATSENTDEETKQQAQDKANSAKDQAKEYQNRTNQYLKDKFPQERRDQAIWRLKKMVAEIQGHQDYQQAIDTLLTLAEEYAGHGQNIAGQSADTVKGAHSDDSLKTAETDLKTIIERFANSTSLDDLFDSINQIYRDADRDPELKNWFKRIDTYIRKCLKEQGYVLQDAATEEWNGLYDQGNFLLRERYRNHTDRILDEVKFVADQFDQDPQNKAFAEATNKLFLDLGNDENGKPTFKPHLLQDLSDVILPAFFENIRYVPIPRIEYKDPQIDLVVENLVLEGDNLAPNVLEFGSDNYWRWGRKAIRNKNKNKVMLSVSGVQCDLRDVAYYVKRKQGFPAVTDKGVMDVVIAGQGLSFQVTMETSDARDHHFFKVDKVDVSIKNMNIILKQSNHKLLFKLFKPLLLKVMNPLIQKAAEKQIRDSVAQLDSIFYSIHQEAQRAAKDVSEDPENAPNVYQRYAQAASDKFAQGKKKKEEVTSDKQVNMAVTQHDSLFPHIKLPGGISTKATEYKELAAKGDKWESPVFSIGSAKESTNLPKLASVSRKPHNVTQGGVRGGNAPQSSSTGISNLDGTGATSSYGSTPVGANTSYGSTSAGAGSSTGAGYGLPSETVLPVQGSQGAQSGAGTTYLSYGGNPTTADQSIGGTHVLGSGANTEGFTAQVDEAFKQPGQVNGNAFSNPNHGY